MNQARRSFQLLPVLAIATACASGRIEDLDEPATGQLLSALQSGSAEATLTLQSNWGSGYCADVAVRNRGDASISSWTVVVDFEQASVTSLWSGARSGSTVTPLDYNRVIQPNGSVSFGFCANISSAAQLPTLTSLSTSGGGTSNPGTGGASNTGGAASTGGANGTGGTVSAGGAMSSGGTTNAGGASSTGGTNGTGGSTSGGGTGGGGSATHPPIQNGCSGYATRFWDCCKPHCGWPSNVPGGVRPINSCSASNQSFSTEVSGNRQSSCNGGDAHMCYGLAPYEVSSTLSYGYAATSSGDVCGRCYQLQFDGETHNGGSDPGSRALAGKTMIVQAINIGFDVGGGQFDLLIPGGGVGAFNACSAQWGVSDSELGAQYGGFLRACKDRHGFNASLETYKSCVAERCRSVFESRGLSDLAAGCHWFVNWFEVADNPTLKFKEVPCPLALVQESGMDRSSRNDVSGACGN